MGTQHDMRIKIKNIEKLLNVPINQPIKCSEDIIKKSIEYGMILIINYKGKKDSHYAGHERTIYPMVIGKSKRGKILLRAWHLKGWSVSMGTYINKVWRLFRVDRILSITFTGMFYRLPPTGYNMNDKGMRGGIIASANFDIIRRNQQSLMKKSRQLYSKSYTVKVNNTNMKISSTNIKNYMSKIQKIKGSHVNILKSMYNNKYAMIIGNELDVDMKLNIISNNENKNINGYIVIDSCEFNDLYKILRKYNNVIFDVYHMVN